LGMLMRVAVAEWHLEVFRIVLVAVRVPILIKPLVRMVMMVMVHARAMTGSPKVAERADRDPKAESDEREAGHLGDRIGKLGGQRRPRQPDRYADRQRRQRMTEPRAGGRPSGLIARPSFLSRYHNDGKPVIWDDGVQHSDGCNGDQQEELLSHRLF